MLINSVDCSHERLKFTVPNTLIHVNQNNISNLNNNSNNISHQITNNDNSYSMKYVQRMFPNGTNQINMKKTTNRPNSAKPKEKANNKTQKQQSQDEKYLSPKTSFNFSYIPLGPQEVNVSKIKKQNDTNLSMYNPNNTSCVYSSADNYWQRRELETQEKLNKIKNEIYQKELGELKEKPTISKNSQKIASKIRSKSTERVYNRLANGYDIRKKNEEIEQIEKKTNRNKAPSINNSSKGMKRTVDDLLQWKAAVERKKIETINNLNTSITSNLVPKINKSSEQILKENKPDYFNKKVEDRLIEQGERIKLKKEEQKEHYIENVMSSEIQKSNRLYKNVESRYNTFKQTTTVKQNSTLNSNRGVYKKKNPSSVNYYTHTNSNNNINDSRNYNTKTNCNYFQRCQILQNLTSGNNKSLNYELNDDNAKVQPTVPKPMQMPIRNMNLYPNQNKTLSVTSPIEDFQRKKNNNQYSFHPIDYLNKGQYDNSKVDEKYVPNTLILNEHSQMNQNEFDNKEDGNKFTFKYNYLDNQYNVNAKPIVSDYTINQRRKEDLEQIKQFSYVQQEMYGNNNQKGFPYTNNNNEINYDESNMIGNENSRINTNTNITNDFKNDIDNSGLSDIKTNYKFNNDVMLDIRGRLNEYYKNKKTQKI